MRKKNIVITGANRGIGWMAAKSLAEKGHRIIMTGRNLEKVQTAAQKIEGDTMCYQMDITNEKDVVQFTNDIGAEIDAIDVLINNAGSIFDDYRVEKNEEQPLDTRVELFKESLELNLIGAYRVTHHLIPLLNRVSRTDIINISSGMGALEGMGFGVPAYRIAKAGLNAFTVYLAGEFSETKIFVNSVCPGWVRTDLGGANAPRALEEGVLGINYLVNDEPNLRGKFIRDKTELPF